MNNNGMFVGTVTKFTPILNENKAVKFNSDGSCKAFLTVHGAVDKEYIRNSDGTSTVKTKYGYISFEVFVPKHMISLVRNEQTNQAYYSFGKFDSVYPGMPIAVEYKLCHDQYVGKDGEQKFRDYLQFVDMSLFEDSATLAELRPIRERRIMEKKQAKQAKQANAGYGQVTVQQANAGYGQAPAQNVATRSAPQVNAGYGQAPAQTVAVQSAPQVNAGYGQAPAQNVAAQTVVPQVNAGSVYGQNPTTALNNAFMDDPDLPF